MKTFALTAALAAASLAGGAAAQDADAPSSGVRAGVLTCQLTGGTNFIVISEADYACVFDVAEEGRPNEIYRADIAKLGIDLSIERAETLKWAVVSMISNFDEGLITGEYVGVSADAALGLGAGARVQVGGLDDSITLQPLSISGREGLGIAAGVEQMSLEFQGTRG